MVRNSYSFKRTQYVEIVNTMLKYPKLCGLCNEQYEEYYSVYCPVYLILLMSSDYTNLLVANIESLNTKFISSLGDSVPQLVLKHTDPVRHVKILEKMLDYPDKFDWGNVNSNGCTLLDNLLRAYNNDDNDDGYSYSENVILRLIALGNMCNPDNTNSGTSSLIAVCSENIPVITLALLGIVSNNTINYVTKCSNSALSYACKHSQASVTLEILPRCTIDIINLVNTDGETPLHITCARANNVEVVKALLDTPLCDYMKTNSSGKTPFQCALDAYIANEEGSLDVIKLFISDEYIDKCNINNVSVCDSTALINICASGQSDYIDKILDIIDPKLVSHIRTVTDASPVSALGAYLSCRDYDKNIVNKMIKILQDTDSLNAEQITNTYIPIEVLSTFLSPSEIKEHINTNLHKYNAGDLWGLINIETLMGQVKDLEAYNEARSKIENKDACLYCSDDTGTAFLYHTCNHAVRTCYECKVKVDKPKSHNNDDDDDDDDNYCSNVCPVCRQYSADKTFIHIC